MSADKEPRPQTQPRVGIIMGSSSDLTVMTPAAEVLRELGVVAETTIVSAHRTPRRMVGYAEEARGRGIQVIIAGAGGAAHLPGMVAALTTLPVIGVPVRTSALSGVDSLLSIVQMPRGVPVATVAINNGKNAGLLAARILALADPELARRLADYQAAEEARVLEEARELEESGPEGFLSRRQA
jgi:phosphoribosylaminoimidazole carboxylase PurE protein